MNQNIFDLIDLEKNRQTEFVELIASENYVSQDVLTAQGSILTNKYAEGYSGKRYYGGCEFIDQIESIAIQEAQKLFKTDYQVNVQPHCGSSANMGVYLGVLSVHDTILGMSLDAGGHLTHGAVPSFSGSKYNFFTSVSYGLTSEGIIDYQQVQKLATEFKPKIIVAGASAYSRKIDFIKFREICDSIGAYLLVDMAHIAGLVATGHHESPFGIADFVTTTTHKTLRGPRGGVIFSKTPELGKKINSAIFPGIQGGPLEHIIAAKAICFQEAQTDSFKNYIKNVLRNIQVFQHKINNFQVDGKKINIVSGQSDNHLLLLDFTDLGLTGKQIENELEKVNITVNKNSVPGDKDPVNPSGIRIGTAAITSREISQESLSSIIDNMLSCIHNLYMLNNGHISSIDYELQLEFFKQHNISLVRNLSIFSKV